MKFIQTVSTSLRHSITHYNRILWVHTFSLIRFLFRDAVETRSSSYFFVFFVFCSTQFILYYGCIDKWKSSEFLFFISFHFILAYMFSFLVETFVSMWTLERNTHQNVMRDTHEAKAYNCILKYLEIILFSLCLNDNWTNWCKMKYISIE